MFSYKVLSRTHFTSILVSNEMLLPGRLERVKDSVSSRNLEAALTLVLRHLLHTSDSKYQFFETDKVRNCVVVCSRRHCFERPLQPH